MCVSRVQWELNKRLYFSGCPVFFSCSETARPRRPAINNRRRKTTKLIHHPLSPASGWKFNQSPWIQEKEEESRTEATHGLLVTVHSCVS
ncbi:hypothetical protein JTE90_018724 [Oedothorax gibbosus]|uniref:Uncharacterized protein n=1 Tax=Oedothorax gibbosus TaxID=931172 RepID=A0AAV6UKW1_9ARAC|nr:hypothetical protein JTE90_018724 [Oedothorax gibbosus]